VLHVNTAIPVRFVAFDALRVDGHDLTGNPWAARRAVLEELGVETWCSRLAELFDDGHALFDAFCQHRLEGIVAKRTTGTYRPGYPGWVKVKNPAYWRRESEIESNRLNGGAWRPSLRARVGPPGRSVPTALGRRFLSKGRRSGHAPEDEPSIREVVPTRTGNGNRAEQTSNAALLAAWPRRGGPVSGAFFAACSRVRASHCGRRQLTRADPRWTLGEGTTVADETVAREGAADRPRPVSVKTSETEYVEDAEDDANEAWPQLPQVELEVCLGETLKWAQHPRL